METYSKIANLLIDINEKNPLVHHITNYVTTNDCANIVLAIGASPVMADAINEVEDIVSISNSLVINIGTLNDTKIESMIKAGIKANKLNIPVILDPVGISASKYRTETIKRLLREINFSVIRGNLSEIKALCGLDSMSKGVDSREDSCREGERIALMAAKLHNTVIAITGAVDYISDGKKIITLHNGNKILTKVTGTGCMTTSLIGAFCGATQDYFLAATLGILTMSLSGEIAYDSLKEGDGIGSFKVKLMDAIYNFSIDDINKRGKIYEG